MFMCVCVLVLLHVYMYYTVDKCIYIFIYICLCVFECTCVCGLLSGAEGSCGLIVRHTLGFDALSIVVIHHLVRDFCQNALSQGGWGGLKIQIKTRSVITNTHTSPAVRDSWMPEFTVESDAVKGLDQ